MTINTADLKKKIIYRSTYRGTKEMDTLLSTFVKKYINGFNKKELIDLSNLLQVDDETLYSINTNKNTPNNIKNNKVLELFKNYIYIK